MRKVEAKAKAILVLLGGIIVFGVLTLAWAIGPGSSEAEQDGMHNCPQPGRWAISVWEGPDGTETGEALASCGAAPVVAAYYLDPQTQGWSYWFGGQSGMATLTTVNNMQGVLALGAMGAPPPSPTVAPSPTPTPTVTATPGAASDVEVLSYRSHQSEYGALYFYGEVENRGSVEVGSVKVVLTLFDGAGKVVGTGDDYVQPSCLSPDESGAFSVYVLDPPDAWERETLQVQWSPMSEWLRDMCYKAFSVSGVSITPGEYGGLTVRGQVTNTGGESATLIRVTFVAYGAADEVLAVDFTFADVDPLPPGHSSPFEIWMTELDSPPASHRTIVEGWAD